MDSTPSNSTLGDSTLGDSTLGDSTLGGRPLVVHVRVVSGVGGGPEKTILNSPRFLSDRGYDCLCVYLRDPNDIGFSAIENRAATSDAPLEAVDDLGIRDFKIVRRLSELLDRRSPAIWHGHDYKSNLLGLILRRRHPMKLVTTVHGWVHRTWKTPLYYFIDRRCLTRYDHVVCVSQDLFDDCQGIGVPGDRLVKIDNAIALEDYAIDLDPRKAKIDLDLDAALPLIIGVGRLSEEKCFHHLIEAVTEINLRSSGNGSPQNNVQLAIAGEGTERESLQRQIDAAGMGQWIRLVGFLSDPRPLYQAADLFVLSSKREGLPNVVLEAMAMRTPIVSTRVAGIPSLVDDCVEGRLIDAEQTDQLVDAMEAFIKSPDTYAKFADAALERIKRDFSFDDRMDQMVKIYRRVLTQGVPGQ